jgi:hypothetical protein
MIPRSHQILFEVVCLLPNEDIRNTFGVNNLDSLFMHLGSHGQCDPIKGYTYKFKVHFDVLLGARHDTSGF